MKNKNIFKKEIAATLIVLFICSMSLNKASAIGPVIDATNLKVNISQVVNQMKEGLKTAQQVKNTYDTVKNTSQALKNFDLTQAAAGASGLAISQIGDIVTKNLGTTKDASTNIFTNGQQIITDLNGYLSKSSTNAIKKTLDDLKDTDSNPYQSTALSDIVKSIRSEAQGTVNKLKVVELADIAKKEICNDSKLKDVIKNGEPKGWIKPKAALKNVDIDELCDSSLTEKNSSSNQNDQYDISSWNIPINENSSSADIENLKNFLMANGYTVNAISSTFNESVSLAIKNFQKDQGLDATGEIDDLTQTAMLSFQKKKEPISGKSSQAAFISIANAGYGGPLTRAALVDPTNSPSGIQAAMQSEINKKITDSQSSAVSKFNANGGIIGNEKCLDKEGKEKKLDPTDPSSAFCDNIVTDTLNSAAKIKADIEAARQSPYLSILTSAQNTEKDKKECTGDKTVCNIVGKVEKVGKYAAILNGILGLGDVTNTSNAQYIQLSSSIDSLMSFDKKSEDIADQATKSKLDYNSNTGNSAKINDAILRYDTLNGLNVQKLNDMVYTYFLITKNRSAANLKLATMSMTSNINLHIGILGSANKVMKNAADLFTRKKALSKINIASQELQKKIQALVKSMIKNNAKKKQLVSLVAQLKDAKTADIPDTFTASLLKDTITDQDLLDVELDYNYINEYRDDAEMDQDSLLYMIPTNEQIKNIETKDNLLSLRIKTYKLGKNLNLSSLGDYTPNVPKKFTYLVSPNDSGTYSESALCNKIGNSICGNLSDPETIEISSTDLEIENICKDIPKAVNDFCASGSSTSTSVCADREKLTNDTINMCENYR